MARYTGPRTKYLRRFGMLPDSTPRRRRKQSDYAVRLEEKQKLRFMYGLLEKQFRKYFEKARRQTGNTEELFVRLLETRLDNVLFRLGLARTREQARQLVNHGHVLVNDKKVNIPSYQVKVGDVVSLKPKSLQIPIVQENIEEFDTQAVPVWLMRQGPAGKISALPELGDVNLEVDVSLIIEYYSR